MVRTRTAFLTLGFGLAFLFTLQAQNTALGFAGIDPEVSFGRPSSQGKGIPSSLYLRTDATLSVTDDRVSAAGQGVPLFIQKQAILAGGLPPSLDDFTAVAHGDGFVSVYSAKEFRPELSAETQVAKGDLVGRIGKAGEDDDQVYGFRVFDGASRLWVNPAYFLQNFQDRVAPKIEEITLVGEGRAYTAETRKNFTQAIRQGDYILAVRVTDPPYSRGSVSGIFRFKAILDGKVIADRKFDSARITDKGLAFLGLEAPSSAIVDDEGRLLLGGQFIPRGLHSLEFSVYDYAGNASSFTWKFSAQ